VRRLFIALGICLVLITGCGDEEELQTDTPSRAVTATAALGPSIGPSTPTPTVGVPPSPEFESFREFAALVQSALDAGDADFFLNDAVISSMECPNVLGSCNAPYPTVIQGISVGLWRSEGTVVPTEEFRLDLRDYFESAPKIHSIAGLFHDVGGAIGGPAYFVIVTTPQAPEKSAKALEFIKDNGRWRFRLYLNTGSADTANEWLSGNCAECYDYWELWQGSD
jgi:hypothetical protein